MRIAWLLAVAILLAALFLCKCNSTAESYSPVDYESCHQLCDITRPGAFRACQIAEENDDSAHNVNPGKRGGPLRATGTEAKKNYGPCVTYHSCVKKCRAHQRKSQSDVAGEGGTYQLESTAYQSDV